MSCSKQNRFGCVCVCVCVYSGRCRHRRARIQIFYLLSFHPRVSTTADAPSPHAIASRFREKCWRTGPAANRCVLATPPAARRRRKCCVSFTASPRNWPISPIFLHHGRRISTLPNNVGLIAFFLNLPSRKLESRQFRRNPHWTGRRMILAKFGNYFLVLWKFKDIVSLVFLPNGRQTHTHTHSIALVWPSCEKSGSVFGQFQKNWRPNLNIWNSKRKFVTYSFSF